MIIMLLSAFLISILIAVLFGKRYVPWLEIQNAKQVIKEEVAVIQQGKNSTPTMGGVMFILSSSVTSFALALPAMLQGNCEHLFILLLALSYGAIGLLDDLEKLRKGQNLGLSSRQKIALQLLAAVVFLLVMRRFGMLHPRLWLPFSGKILYLSKWLYDFLAVFVIVGTANAVNITDGVDGLAAGTAIPVFMFFVLVTVTWGEDYLLQGIVASAMVGGLFGFLFFNFNPARCFMGDTGSLFIGGAIAGLALSYEMPLILILLCAIFILETFSDIIQVGYFRLSHGKRVFKMAPFHHHLQMGGWTGRAWTEPEIFCLYTGISTICMVLSFLIVILAE